MKRSGHAARMYQANAPGPDGLTCPEPYAAGYLAGAQSACTLSSLCPIRASLLRLVAGVCLDADRFHSDVAGEELAIRQQKYHREQQIYENKRLVNAEREEHRWKRDEEAKAAEEAYWVEQRDLGIKVGTVYSCVNLK